MIVHWLASKVSSSSVYVFFLFKLKHFDTIHTYFRKKIRMLINLYIIGESLIPFMKIRNYNTKQVEHVDTITCTTAKKNNVAFCNQIQLHFCFVVNL